MRFVSCGLLVLAAALSARAQPAAPAPPNWSLGLRGGFGLSNHLDYDNYVLWTGGAIAGRYLPRARLSLVAEALLDGRHTLRATAGPGSPWAEETDTYLFLPIGIRTGHPNSVAHALLQAGPVLALGSPAPSADGYQPRPLSAVAVAGIELRLNPRAQPHELLLGLQLREGLTPYTDLPRPTPADPRPASGYFWWTGLTLSWVWHRDGAMPQ